ncbi:putative NADH kinase [Cinnamomum micranthum f. kanehirae]|uniref:NADH kinase n=1 Tax=Cinnamomum micranthum f. kanehirae TaxID=337451 RepID=A0A443PEH4_9MAGN|nr:putative NADH kinase [Cinnamomum micranthum f. kanehirae]
MSRRRVLLMLKPLDVYTARFTESSQLHRFRNPQILRYLDDRCKVHNDTISLCQDVLQRRSLDWEPFLCNRLEQPIRHVDLVISVGGDGTLLQASHFIDDSIPIVGVNSDPTRVEEVQEFSHDFDATRSTGYLCAATAGNFEQVLDEILKGHRAPSGLSRISVCINNHLLPTYALNDILVAHPCPATASWFSFRIKGDGDDGQERSPLVNCRSSGLRVSTAAGSTAAMLSAGGFPMPISSQDLQYMVREPILPGASNSHLMHGVIKSDQTMHVTWYKKQGKVYIDGSHVFHSVNHGDTIEVSSRAPILKVYLPPHLLQ